MENLFENSDKMAIVISNVHVKIDEYQLFMYADSNTCYAFIHEEVHELGFAILYVKSGKVYMNNIWCNQDFFSLKDIEKCEDFHKIGFSDSVDFEVDVYKDIICEMGDEKFSDKMIKVIKTWLLNPLTNGKHE